MKLPVALALVIGLIGAILTYLYVGPLAGHGPVHPRHVHRRRELLRRRRRHPRSELLAPREHLGDRLATIALILVGLVASPLLVGLIVGAMTAVVILGALVPALGFVPGSVFGFATTAAFGLLTSASGTDFSPPTGPFTVMLLSFVVGGLYGWVSSILVGKIVAAPAAASA